MKAAILTDWNRIEIKDVPIPEIGEEECLIKVAYAGVCGSDVHITGGHHPTAKVPLIMGHEFVGTIEKIKTNIRNDLKVGDRVVAEPLISCNICEACIQGNKHVCRSLKLLGIHAPGSFAEYIKVSAAKVVKIDDRLTDRAAALSEPFAVGFHVVQRSGLRVGDSALIIGGGPIGLIIGMVAKMSGASEVVFSEINPKRINKLKHLGFDKIINPQSEDQVARVDELTDKKGFDVVYEVSGSKAGILFSAQACRIRGTIVPVGFHGEMPRFDIMKVIFKELSVKGSRVYSLEHFERGVRLLAEIVSRGAFNVNEVISEEFSLDEINEAIQYAKEGKSIGKILIRIV